MRMYKVLEETKKYVVFKVPAEKKLAVIHSLIPEEKLSEKEFKRLKKVIAYNRKNKSKNITLEEYRKKNKI